MDPKTAPRPEKQTDALNARRARVLQRMAKLGPVLQGTITPRTILREDPQAPGKQKEYGPYYQWIWKRDGKTVTVNLSPGQAKVYQKAIDEHRKLEALLDELRALSLKTLETTTEGVQKRNRNRG